VSLQDPNPCLIVAEVAQAHDGSLGAAHAYIDAVAAAGADAVKFQTHIAAAESTPAEGWRVRFSPQDATRYDYWKRMEFSEEGWRGLKHHADERGLKFLSSPFSEEAVDLLVRVGVAAWKIASGELGNALLLERIARTTLPVMLSSGMSEFSEIDAAVAHVRSAGLPVTVLQCTSLYPCPPERVGLNLMRAFRDRYGCDVGLSDHSGTIFPALAAATLGANVLEVHVTFSRDSFGPDVPASVTIPELRQLADGVRFIERMNANPVSKDVLAPEMPALRALFTRSIVAQTSLDAGTILKAEHLALKKPGTGMSPAQLQSVIGRTLRRAVETNQMIQDSDLQ
jgi:N-acetylneuraminate synthase